MPPTKKSCASGTLLKELLQQGGKILFTAAAKVDQFAPATVSSTEALERMEKLEQKVKKYHEHAKSTMAEIKTTVADLRELPAMIKSVDERTTDNAKTSDVMENHNALGVRLDEILTYLRQRDETPAFPDFQKMSFNIELIMKRLDALERNTAIATPSTLQIVEDLTPRRSDDNRDQRRQDDDHRSRDVDRGTEPASRKRDDERTRELIERTKEEVRQVREEIVKVNATITEEWDNKNVMEAARKLAELKEKRSRLQAQESTLDRELLYLETKLRTLDPTEDRHRMDDPRHSDPRNDRTQPRDHRRDSSRR